MNGGNMSSIKTGGQTTTFADKMNVVVVMMSFRTFLATESILNRVVGSWNGMHDSFINKCL